MVPVLHVRVSTENASQITQWKWLVPSTKTGLPPKFRREAALLRLAPQSREVRTPLVRKRTHPPATSPAKGPFETQGSRPRSGTVGRVSTGRGRTVRRVRAKRGPTRLGARYSSRPNHMPASPPRCIHAIGASLKSLK